MSMQKGTRFGIISIVGIFAVLGLLFAACKQLTLPGTSTDQTTFTVTFDSNGGSDVLSQNKKYGEKVVEPRSVDKDGHIFRGWFLDNGIFAQAWDFEIDLVTENITLYAQWTENSNPTVTFFTVTFVSFTTKAVPKQIIPSGEKASQPQGLTLGGQTLSGWYTDGNYDIRWNFNDDIVTQDITLYAQWVPYDPQWFTVTFDSNGGTYVDGQLKINRAYIEEPVNVSKEYYIIEGWYADNETFTARWNFNDDIVTQDIILYAKWLDADFGLNTINNIFNVSNAAEWSAAVSAITGGGNNRNYIINIIGDFSITGRTTNTFGNVSGLRVSIRGESRTLYLSGNGSILRIGANQTVILWNPTLQGRSGNNNSLVYTSGTFTMNGGEISGNTAAISIGYSTSFGGGVYVANNGNFTMNGGNICGNTVSASSSSSYAYGGGVYVINGGNFTMNGGEIYGNTSTAANAANSRGGGVYSSGRLRISAGTIYGLDEPEDIRNIASAGAAFHRGSTGTAQYGTFNGATWISNGDLNSPENNTIVVSE